MGVLFKCTFAVGMMLLVTKGTAGSTADDHYTMEWYSDAVQNTVAYDVEDTDPPSEDLFGHVSSALPASVQDGDVPRLRFNGAPTTMARLADQLKGSDSICLQGVDYGKHNGLPAELAELITLIGATGVDEQFINLNMEYLPGEPPTDCEIISIARDGALSFAGKPVALSDLSGLLPADRKVGIESNPALPPPSFSTVLAVVEAVGKKNIHHLFITDRAQQIEIAMEIYQTNAAGVRDVLAAPRITTAPGYAATISVGENATGWKHYRPEQDEYGQEDLAHLGIRFSVKPQIFGDYVRVTGMAILTRSTSRQEAFQQRGIPVYSYSVNKTVAPFSVVLPEINDGAEFPVADVDGNITRCRVSVTIIDSHGMSQADRDMARSTGRNSPPE